MSPQADAITVLIKRLSKLPGMGARSARRVALHLLSDRDKNLAPLQAALQAACDEVVTCANCGMLDTQDPCKICADDRRDPAKICVVQGVGDVWAMERTGFYNGLYHILGGVLSALDGIGPDRLAIDSLTARIAGNDPVREVILALGATVDGQATSHYLADHIRKIDKTVTLSRLAYGVPIGGEVEYLDDSTLATAMKSRAAF